MSLTVIQPAPADATLQSAYEAGDTIDTSTTDYGDPVTITDGSNEIELNGGTIQGDNDIVVNPLPSDGATAGRDLYLGGSAGDATPPGASSFMPQAAGVGGRIIGIGGKGKAGTGVDPSSPGGAIALVGGSPGDDGGAGVGAAGDVSLTSDTAVLTLSPDLLGAGLAGLAVQVGGDLALLITRVAAAVQAQMPAGTVTEPGLAIASLATGISNEDPAVLIVSISGIGEVARFSVDGVIAENTKKAKLNAGAAPTVNADSTAGYAIGSLWHWPANGLWIARSVGVGAAVWDRVLIYAGSATAASVGVGDGGSDGTYADSAHVHSALATLEAEAGTARNTALADSGKTVRCTSGSAITITAIELAQAGTVIEYVQEGAGQITIAAGAGVTLRYDSAVFNPATAAQWTSIFVKYLTATSVQVLGDLDPV